MKTTSNRKRQITRNIRIERPIDPTGRGAVRITTQEGQQEPCSVVYACTVFGADFGLGVYLTKEEGEGTDESCQSYTVNLDGLTSTCECKGYLRHRHCKHVEGLLVLQGRGKLDVPPAIEEPALHGSMLWGYSTDLAA
jgi:hypothetical protein